MGNAVLTTALYVAACLVIPFLWGVLVHSLFRRIERATLRRRGGRPTSSRPAGTERAPSMWDYQI